MKNENLNKVEELYWAIGPRNRLYYQKRWARYISSGLRVFDWNWAALVFGWLWFAYRKMWFVCLAYFFLIYPLFELVARVAGKNGFLVAIMAFKFFIVPAIANQMYFVYVRSTAKKLGKDKKTRLGEVLADRFQTILDSTASNPKVF